MHNRKYIDISSIGASFDFRGEICGSSLNKCRVVVFANTNDKIYYVSEHFQYVSDWGLGE